MVGEKLKQGSWRCLGFRLGTGLLLLSVLVPRSATGASGPELKAGKAYRGVAFLSSAIGRDVSVKEIETFVAECKIDFVVIDYAWITAHWERTDGKTVDGLAKKLQRRGVVVAAMYRPRALYPRDAQVHFARNRDGTLPKSHLSLCFAHEDSVLWGAGWGEKILKACPSIRHMMLYNVLPTCHCEKCSGGEGAKHVASFFSTCRTRWKKIRPQMRLGHVCSLFEPAEHIDFFCPFFSVQRNADDRPVEADRQAAQMKTLREKVKDKPFIPLAKICWSSATKNTTEDVVNTILSCGRNDVGFLLWYYGWVFHSEKKRYDPKTIVLALGGDWGELKRFLKEVPKKPKKTGGKSEVPKDPKKTEGKGEGGNGWIYFESRESQEGSHPKLVLLRAGREPQEVPASRDAVLLSYMPANWAAGGIMKRLSIHTHDTNRVLIGFDLPQTVKGLKKAELVLDLKISKQPPTEPIHLALHLVQKSWREMGITWKTQPPFHEEPAQVVKIEIEPAVVRWDVTEIVKKWLAGTAENHGLLIRMRWPGKSVAPVAPPPRRGGPERKLLDTLPWENDTATALEKGAAQKRLILACVRADYNERNSNKPEILIQTLLFTDPTLVDLVKKRFIPLRVMYKSSLYKGGRVPPTADTLRPLGASCTELKAPALCVSTPEGKMIAALQSIGTFDVDMTRQFLLDALAKGKGTSKPEGDDPEALLAAGDLSGAEKGFKKRRSPEKEWGLCRIAARSGDHGKAAELAHALAKRKSALGGDAAVQEGVSLMRLGDFEKAARILEKAVNRRPAPSRAPEALYYLGALATVERKADQAKKTWERLQKDHPDSLWALRAESRMAWPAFVGPFENLKSLPDLPKTLTITEKPVPPAKLTALVERAITYLVETQEPDGSWAIEEEQYRAGVTAVGVHALDAWVEDLKGDLRKDADKGIRLAMKWVEEYIAEEDPERANSFGSAFLLDFLLSRYLRTRDASFKPNVKKGVQFVLGGQGPGGAWSYSRAWGMAWDGSVRGWPKTDKGRYHSMNTGPSLLFLAKARDAGFDVDEKALAKGVDALKDMRKSPGVYTYTYPIPRNFESADASIARAPACEQALLLCKAVKKEDLVQTVNTFMKYRHALRIPVKMHQSWVPPHGLSCYFYFFAYYHAVLAIRELGGESSRKMLQQIRGDILNCPELDATWVDWHQAGKPFGTASALLILRLTGEGK
ncbi:MAG: DNRLRE domain-containing protein [Planctomycetota bacterium]